MKKALLFGIINVLIGYSYAKIVKFSVDMSKQTISPNGIHISGDFQDEAGFPTDWDSKSILLSKELGSDIYSVVVNIPAFRTYQYKFVNGEQFYEVEFVPEKSRIGFDFNDNRWIYVDSLANDTLLLPPLTFGGNAPAGMRMIRFKVDLASHDLNHKNGIHLSSSFNNWNPSRNQMVSFSKKNYESIEYIHSNSTQIEYIFVNGFTEEKVNLACVNQNNKRTISVETDTVLNEVCFNECKACVGKTTHPSYQTNTLSLFPNPAKSHTTLKISPTTSISTIVIKDMKGIEIQRFLSPTKEERIDTHTMAAGVYFIEVFQSNTRCSRIKLLID